MSIILSDDENNNIGASDPLGKVNFMVIPDRTHKGCPAELPVSVTVASLEAKDISKVSHIYLFLGSESLNNVRVL